MSHVIELRRSHDQGFEGELRLTGAGKGTWAGNDQTRVEVPGLQWGTGLVASVRRAIQNQPPRRAAPFVPWPLEVWGLQL